MTFKVTPLSKPLFFFKNSIFDQISVNNHSKFAQMSKKGFKDYCQAFFKKILSIQKFRRMVTFKNIDLRSYGQLLSLLHYQLTDTSC